MKTFNPLYSKRGGLGVLALFCSLFVLVLLTFLFWPGSELVAKPTDIVESVSEVVLSEPVIIPVISGNITKTVAVSFDEPRPKISPELVKELKELKKDRKRAKVLINVRDDAALVALQKTVSDAGGQITQSFSVGDVAVVDLPADKVEEVSQAVGVEEISVEREYVAFLSDRIPAFGVDKVWESNITGKNVKIAVLDTGVGPHDNISVYGARSFVSGEDTADLNGHGTHVAGIAQGVARGAQIYNAKVLSRTGSGSTSQIIAGINWAADNDVDIISMSFGGMFTELDGPLASAVKDAIQRGVVFVVASGNCRQGCGGFFGVTTPGNVKEVITVGAVDDGNVVASFSSGDAFSDYIKPDITAPGKDITSTWLNNGWKTLSGTSMSTPFVSGVVALMLEKESLTHSQVKAKLEGTAIDLGTAGKDTSYGAGLVNVSWLIPVVVNVTINQTNATNVTNTTIPVNETVPIVPISNETNVTEPAPVLNETNPTEPTPSNETTPHSEDDNMVEDVDGYYVTVPVGEISSVQSEDAEICSEHESVDVNTRADEVKEVSIKIPYNSTFYVYSGEVNASSDEQISSMATGQGYIDYDDSFTYQSSNNDGIVWGGISLDVGLDGEESGTKVICFDWCGDGNIDHCFADTSADFSSCTAKSSVLSGICSQSGKCVVGSRDGDHVIDTGSSGSKWTCGVDSRYYANCGSTSYKYYDISAKAYYVISPRQYDCNSNGGTYDDVGKYSTSSPTSQVRINKDLSCGTGKGCDESIDDSSADFGSSGTSAPSAPCSFLNGYGDCDSNSDCMSGNCACVGWCWGDTSTDYCCAAGQAWINNACTTCDSCSTSGQKRRNGNDVQQCTSYGSNLCWTTTTTLGNRDFCDELTTFNQYCQRNEYDCEDGECASGLACKGLTDGDTITLDGCCYSYEEWDSSTHTCKRQDGQTCTAAADCYGNYCVYGICRSAATYCGDTHCDTGETYDNCKADCNPPLGHDDYCKWKSGGCARNEYDCDSNSECASGLACVGSSMCSIFECGCCKSGESWDANANTCKKQDGQTCTAASECYGNYCVYGICRSASTYCGDTHCDAGETYESCSADCNPSLGHDDYCKWKGACTHGEYDCDYNSECGANLYCKGNSDFDITLDGCCYSYEEWDVASNKCKKQDGQSCSAASECYGSHCVYGICRSAATYCGDTHCDTGETYDNCKADCNPPLGHDDYCQWKTGGCARNEYDCDSNSQCASGLACVGSSMCSIYECGCCNSGEAWDANANLCKKSNGAYCSAASECAGGYCLYNYCWNQPYKVGDTYCDANAGETCSNSPVDCKKCDGASCSVASECRGGYCLHNACWNANYKVGDDYCDEPWESKSNSPNDCFGDLDVIQITSYPSIVDQGQTFVVKAKVKNIGTIRDTLKLEAGIAPDSWQNFVISDEYSASVYPYLSTTKNCCGNDFYSAYQVTLDPAQEEEISFTLKAPTIHTTDGCNSSWNVWDSSHTLVVGLYNECFKGYVQYKAKDIKIRDRYCYSNSGCSANEVCDFTNGIPGVCAVAKCTDECKTNGQYFCSVSELFQCTNTDTDTCLEQKHIAYCTGSYACTDGQSTCSSTPPQTRIQIDYAGANTVVNKQSGDLIQLKLVYSRDEDVQPDYDANAFTLSGCSDSFTITADTTCTLEAKDKTGQYSIGIKNGAHGIVKIIRNPSLVMLTDRGKLLEEFSQTAEVDSLLSQAYTVASSGGKEGIVYDLEWYLSGNPWSSNNYDLYTTKSEVLNNDYAMDVSAFVDARCPDCKEIVIVGDDKVVPYFRRDPHMSTSALIVTDSGYITRSNIPFSSSDEIFYNHADNKYQQGKNIIFIMPRNANSDVQNRIDALKKILETGEYRANVSISYGDTIACSDLSLFGGLSSSSLIVFGTEQNNNAYNCFPFQKIENSVSIERNPWSKKQYSILVNTNDPVIIGDFNYKVNYSQLDNVESESMYYIRVAREPAMYSLMGASIVIFMVGSSGLGIVAVPQLVAQFSSIAGFAAGGIQTANDCWLNRESYLQCGVSGILTAADGLILIKTFAPLKSIQTAATNLKNPPTAIILKLDANQNTIKTGLKNLQDAGFTFEKIIDAQSGIKTYYPYYMMGADDVVGFYSEVNRIKQQFGSVTSALRNIPSEDDKLQFIIDIMKIRRKGAELADPVSIALADDIIKTSYVENMNIYVRRNLFFKGYVDQPNWQLGNANQITGVRKLIDAGEDIAVIEYGDKLLSGPGVSQGFDAVSRIRGKTGGDVFEIKYGQFIPGTDPYNQLVADLMGDNANKLGKLKSYQNFKRDSGIVRLKNENIDISRGNYVLVLDGKTDNVVKAALEKDVPGIIVRFSG